MGGWWVDQPNTKSILESSLIEVYKLQKTSQEFREDPELDMSQDSFLPDPNTEADWSASTAVMGMEEPNSPG